MSLLSVIMGIPVIVMSIILHEVAHGWAAYINGDPTAKQAGRLTLNPIPHIDLQGTIIIPGVLLALRYITGLPFWVIGWAKPVPINPSYFGNWRNGMAMTGAAGPLTNIIIAVFLSFLYKILSLSCDLTVQASFIFHFGQAIIFAGLINIFLAVFNLIPIPPLDGSRIVVAFLRPNQIRKYLSLERFGLGLVIAFLFLGGFRILFPIVTFLFSIIFGISLS
ncbi:MAG: site-2 protease family protein [Candidatus Aureabacteria bacterium]|nr:site-2 protease family protein [Candidatus Auribacterota bacterium]MCK5655869.1 site-2 protease family protein [Candidatus Auribacterota bacterium]